MTYIYSLYDVRTDKLMYRGTPTQLMEAGLYKTMGAPNAAWRAQIKGAKPQRWRVEREKPEPVKQKKPYQHKAKDEGSGKPSGSGMPSHRCGLLTQSHNGALPKGEPFLKEEKPSELQQDVHWLCRYNAKARKLGRKELSYGQWAGLGKPEEPV